MATLKPSITEVDGIIADFCAAVAEEPLCYFSEADLQGLLYARLRDAFPAQVETACRRGPDSKGRYQTGMVHREYGAGSARRIDISVFGAQDLARIDGPDLKAGKKYLDPLFAVELGTEKTVDTAVHLASDLTKLSKATQRGYLIHFFRDVTKADVGTKSRIKTEERIKRIFRTPVADATSHEKVKILCFLLRIARSAKKIYGKCEMFDPETLAWRKVNLARVRNEVLEALR